MVAGRPDDKTTITQAQFDRLTGASRDDWRKWDRRGLVTKPRGGYAWVQVVHAIALRGLESSAGIEAVAYCWDDVRDDLLAHIHQPVLDLVLDPGTSQSSRPQMRAFVSTADSSTADVCRRARTPHVLPLADELKAARAEFERIVARSRAHGKTGIVTRPAQPDKKTA